MGKRELLLIGAFVILGSAIYWATAPEPAPGQRGFSLSTLINHIRQEIRGNPATAELTTTTTLPRKPELTEIRFEIGPAPLTIVGETRDDITCELSVWSNGPDEAEAKRWAAETKLRVSDLGTSIVIGVDYPDPGQQRASLAVKMPSALAVRVQPSRGKISITNLASVDLAEARGPVSVTEIKDRLVIVHRGGGELRIENIGTLKLSTRGSVAQIKDVKGEMVVQGNAGEIRGVSLNGPIDIEANNTRITLDDLSTVRKPIRINTIGGAVALGGISSETRIEGRKTRITAAIGRPAPIAIYNDDDEPIRVTLPPSGGFQLDALASDATLTLPSGLLETKVSGNEQRASGAVRGGGPTLTLRSSRGAIEVSAAASSPLPATSAEPKEKTGS
jgi:hypothetical protein